MALVRKLQKGNKFVYENVGEFDADELAKKFTSNLEKQANELGLSGSDKQAFMQYGAELARAVKNGDVTKNANGNLDLHGNYNLNNVYTDSDIEKLKKNKKVGRGADVYTGEHQQSYNFFTSDKTKNFRDKNHILGLVKNTFDSTLNNVSEIKAEEEKPIEKYTFSDAFSSSILGGNDTLQNQWLALNNTNEARSAAVLKALQNADYTKWAESFDNYDEAGLKAAVNPIVELLNNNDINGARNAALGLGFSIDPYFAAVEEVEEVTDPTRAEQIEEHYANLKKKLMADNPTWTEEYVDWYINDQKEKELKERQLEYDTDYDKKLKEAFILQLKENFKDKEDGSDRFLISQGKLKSYDFGNGDGYYSIANQLERMLNAPEVSAIEKLSALKALYDRLPENIKTNNPYFEEVKEGDYKGYIRIKPEQTKLGNNSISFLFDKNGNYKTVHNNALPQSKYYKDKLNEFTSVYEQNNPRLKFKEGGILIAQNGTSTAWISNWEKEENAKKKNQEQNQKVKAEQTRIHDKAEETNKTPEQVKYDETQFSKAELSAADKTRIGAVLTDIAGLGLSLTPLTLTSALTGIGATSANVAADVMDNKSWGEALWNNAGSYAMDVASFIPGLKLMKLAKTAKTVKYLAPVVMAATGAYQIMNDIPQYKSVWDKVNTDKEFTVEDWRTIGELFSLAITGGTALKNYNKLNKVKNASTKKTQVKGKDGKYHTVNDVDGTPGLDYINNADQKDRNTAFQLATGNDNLKLPTKKKLYDRESGKGWHDTPVVKSRDFYEVPNAVTLRSGNLEYDYNPAWILRKDASISLPNWNVTNWARKVAHPHARVVSDKKGGRLIPKAQEGWRFKKWFDSNYTDSPENGRKEQYFDLFDGNTKNTAYNLDAIIKDMASKDEPLDWTAMNALWKDETTNNLEMFKKYAKSDSIKNWNTLFNRTGLNDGYFNYNENASAYNGVTTNARRALMNMLQNTYNNKENLFRGRYFDSNTGQWVTPEGQSSEFNTTKTNPENSPLVGVVGEDGKVTPNENNPLNNHKNPQLGTIFNENGDIVDSEGNIIIKKGSMTGSTEEQEQIPLNKNLDLTELSEAARATILNRENTQAAKDSTKYSVPTKKMIHRGFRITGPIERIWQAQMGAGTLYDIAKASQTASSMANTAAALEAALKGNNLKYQALSDYSNSIRSQIQASQDLVNQDLAQNIETKYLNDSNIANKEKSDAETMAQAKIQNARNFDSLWAAHNLRQSQKYQSQEQLANLSNLKNSELQRQAAMLEYEEAVKKNPNNPTTAWNTLQEKLGKIASAEAIRGSRIIGNDTWHYTSILKKGNKINSTDKFILQSSKDHNKRQLEEAKEFYKNIRRKKK